MVHCHQFSRKPRQGPMKMSEQTEVAFIVPTAPFVHFQSLILLAQAQTDSFGLAFGKPKKADFQNVGRNNAL